MLIYDVRDYIHVDDLAPAHITIISFSARDSRYSYDIKIIEKLASKVKVGIGERINWIKELSRAKLLQHYKSANIFIMLSEHEAYEIVIVEALASGTLYIVTKAGALSEFVDDEMCIEATLPIRTGELVEILFKSIRTDGKQDERRDFMVKKCVMSYR